jgi:hypothetical protein
LTFNMTNAMLTQDPAMRPMTMLPNVFAWFIMATLTCDVLMWELTPVAFRSQVWMPMAKKVKAQIQVSRYEGYAIIL